VTTRNVLVALLLGLLLMTRAGAVTLDLEALDALDSKEQHRQLSLLLLVSAGVDEALLADLGVPPREQAPEGEQPGQFRAEDYTTPLARIVDQSTLLSGAYRLFRFTLDNESRVRARLDALEAAQPSLGGSDATATLTEDTILIRQAIANAMAGSVDTAAGRDAALRYRQHTVVLRNALEFAQFKVELDAITDRAIASVGGKLDAYQRMFDDETNTGTFDRRIRSAELIYLPEGEFDPRAGELTEEMLRNMVLEESQPHR